MIRLSCRIDVQQDMRRELGPVPPSSHEAYSLAHELYGSTRMLLAVLDRPQLEDVCVVRRRWLAGGGRRLGCMACPGRTAAVLPGGAAVPACRGLPAK